MKTTSIIPPAEHHSNVLAGIIAQAETALAEAGMWGRLLGACWLGGAAHRALGHQPALWRYLKQHWRRYATMSHQPMCCIWPAMAVSPG